MKIYEPKKKVKKPKVVKFELDLLPVKFYFTLGNKNHRKFMLKEFDLNSDIELSGSTVEILGKDSYQHLVMSVRKSKDIYALKAMIVHELTHATDWVMEHHGIKDNEFRAYCNQYIYQTIMPKLDEYLISRI